MKPMVPSIINGVKSMISNPTNFVKQPAFLLIWGVYCGTYITANSIEALCERSEISSFYPKLIATSFVNISLLQTSDRILVNLFKKGYEKKQLAITSKSLFASRDSLTMISSFCLPAILSYHPQNYFHYDSHKSDVISQFLCPISIQIISTPLHLLGLDIYNRDTSSLKERFSFVKREYGKTVLARMSRILPAFGIGGVLNKYLRQSGNTYLQSDNFENESVITAITPMIETDITILH